MWSYHCLRLFQVFKGHWKDEKNCFTKNILPSITSRLKIAKKIFEAYPEDRKIAGSPLAWNDPGPLRLFLRCSVGEFSGQDMCRLIAAKSRVGRSP